MIGELSRLSSSELELIYKAPVLVCILIAGADGDIDRKEIKKAINFAQKKQMNSDSPVAVLFKEVAQDFEDKLKILIQGYPYEATQRTPLLVEELSHLNQLWPKVSPAFSQEFYQVLLTIAQEIATSSGGMLGIKSVGSEEARLVKLGMIKNPSSR
jgi:hypothetical protein